MSVQIKRKANESTYNLLRRFQDVYKKSRVGVLTKKSMYFEKPKTKSQIKEDALRRKHNRERRDYLIKIGKISDEPIGNNKFNKKK